MIFVFEYRNATPTDVKSLANLLLEVSTFTNLIYNNQYPEEIVPEKVQASLGSENGSSSYKNIFLCELITDNVQQIIGMVKFYDSRLNERDLVDLKNKIGQEQFESVEILYSLNKENSMYISAIITKALYRRSGLAHKLLEHVIQIAKKLKYNYVTLHVWDANANAVKFYLKNGFIIDEYVTIPIDTKEFPKNKKMWLAYLPIKN